MRNRKLEIRVVNLTQGQNPEEVSKSTRPRVRNRPNFRGDHGGTSVPTPGDRFLKD